MIAFMTVGVSFGLDRRRGHASPPPGSCPVWHPAVASFVAVALALELVGAVLHAASDVGERKVDRRVVLQLGAGLRPSAHVRNPCPFVE